MRVTCILRDGTSRAIDVGMGEELEIGWKTAQPQDEYDLEFDEPIRCQVLTLVESLLKEFKYRMNIGQDLNLVQEIKLEP